MEKKISETSFMVGLQFAVALIFLVGIAVWGLFRRTNTK